MKKTGSMNHVRFTVSDIPHAESFYDPLLRYMGYELAEKSEERLAWKMPSPAGNRQWVILSAASEVGRRRKHDRSLPGAHQPPQAFFSAYAIASSKPSRRPSAHAASHPASDSCDRAAAK
jgi:hypothetical protein